MRNTEYQTKNEKHQVKNDKETGLEMQREPRTRV